MRFDPQANFVGTVEDTMSTRLPRRRSRLRRSSDDGEGSSLKAASVVVLFGLLAGIGIWMWSEGGIPGLQWSSASAGVTDPADHEAVVQYAEALIAGSTEASRVAAATGNALPSTEFANPRLGRGQEEYDAGRSKLSMGRFEEAVGHFNEAIRLHPEWADAHYRLGLAYVQAGNMRAARLECSTLETLDPDLASLLSQLID